MDKLHDICAMKKKLIGWAQEAMSNGPDTVDTEELGEVIDMIKDLYQAEYYCQKSCYYQTVTDAMENSGEPYDKHTFWNEKMTDRKAGSYDHMAYHKGKFNLDETVATMKEAWKDADPDLKQKMKTEFGNLLKEMN